MRARKSRRLQGRNSADVGFEGVEALEPRSLLSWSIASVGSTFTELGERVTSTVTADFNRDGLPDLAVATGRTIWIMKGLEPTGLGTSFLSRPEVAARLNTGVGLLAVADINGDSLPDLLAAQISQPVRGSGWLRGLTTRVVNLSVVSFAPRSFTRFDGRAASITTGNIDGDGRLDVVLTTDPVRQNRRNIFGQPQVPVERGLTHWTDLGPNGFRARTLSQGESDESPNAAPILVDLNNDGRSELVSIMHPLIPVERVRSGRDVPNRSTVLVRSFIDGRLRIIEQIRVDVMVTSIAEADLRGVGDRGLVFSWYTGFGPNGGGPQNGVGTIGIEPPNGNSSLRLTTPELVRLQRPDEGEILDEYPSAQRILGVRDLNGDGRQDIAIISVHNYITIGGEPPLVLFTQVIQDANGALTPADTHTFRVSSAANGYGIAPRHTQAFLLFDIRRIGRPDLVAFESAIQGGSELRAGAQRLSLYFNTSTWKPPSITDVFYSAPFGSSPASASVYVYRSESSRFATITSVEVYVDLNGNGTIDAGEQNVSTNMVREFSSFDFPYDLARVYVVDFLDVDLSFNTRLLAVAIDSTGARSDPFSFRVRL